MFFFHVLDDYVLQGCLANLKQKEWWKKNAPNELYKFDYIMALVCHSISWAFMITLLLVIATISLNIYQGINFQDNLWILLLTYPINVTIHAIVDDLKANKHAINLIQDQIIHFGQILVTFGLFMLVQLLH